MRSTERRWSFLGFLGAGLGGGGEAASPPSYSSPEPESDIFLLNAPLLTLKVLTGCRATITGGVEREEKAAAAEKFNWKSLLLSRGKPTGTWRVTAVTADWVKLEILYNVAVSMTNISSLNPL